jgi:uncharacterized protein (DUF362 family)
MLTSWVPEILLKIPEGETRIERRCRRAAVGVVSCHPTDDVPRAIKQAAELIGGLGEVVKKGDTVFIKTNADPQVVNIEPRFAMEIVKMAFECGARRVIMNKYRGYSAEKYGAELVDIEKPPFVRVEAPGGGLVHNDYVFSPVLMEADVVITIQRMKTHPTTEVTLGMKNLFGLLPSKAARLHSRWFIHFRPLVWEQLLAMNPPESGLNEFLIQKGFLIWDDDFCRGRLIDINVTWPPSFTVLDGIVAMEKSGPWGGKPVESNLIVVGYNPIATDMVGAYLMGFNPEVMPLFKLAEKKGLGPSRLSDVKVYGRGLEEVRFKCAPAPLIPREDSKTGVIYIEQNSYVSPAKQEVYSSFPELAEYMEKPDMIDAWITKETVESERLKLTAEGETLKETEVPVVKLAFTRSGRWMEVWLHPWTRKVLGILPP